MLTLLKSVLAIGAALVLLGSAASAQSRARACVDDIKKNCASVEPGEGRIAGCIKEHLNDLSPACQSLVAGAAAAAKACAADLKQQCAHARGKDSLHQARPRQPQRRLQIGSQSDRGRAEVA